MSVSPPSTNAYEPWANRQLAVLPEQALLSAILCFAVSSGQAPALAARLLRRYGSIHTILNTPILELRAERGLGPRPLLLLQIIKECLESYYLRGAEQQECLREPALVQDFFRSRIGSMRHEVFAVAFLDSGYNLHANGVEILTEGTVDRAAVYPRRVIEAAMRRDAAALLLAHNHPNGDVTPSAQDKLLTRSVVLAATPLQIQVVDHLIVTARDVFSFRQEGLL